MIDRCVIAPLLGLALLLTCAATAPAQSRDAALRVYVGTYTAGGKSKGIYRFELDPSTGATTRPELAAESANPSFLAIHPSRRFLYAVNEVANFGGNSGAVSAFAIDPQSGSLKPLNQGSSHGSGPCHIVVDKQGRHVLVANYGGGSVAALAVGEDGRLGEATAAVQHKGSGADPRRQQGPHAHSINLDAANRFAVAADLGLDKMLVYRFDQDKGTLTPNDPPSTALAPASGPRHFAFHPDGRHAYVINEMKNTVTAFDYDPDRGRLEEVQTIGTLPEGYRGTSHTAEVQVHPSGQFVYGSNRGHDSIAIFAVDAGSGKLRAVGHQPTQGKTPRNFGIDPSGRFLLAANQGSGTIVVFRIDAQTGELRPTGASVEVPAPVCVKFVPKDN
jgi:6-phosphogluconolactonase